MTLVYIFFEGGMQIKKVPVIKNCGAGVLVLWNLERWKCKAATGRFAR